MELPECSVCKAKNIVSHMEYERTIGRTDWFVCYNHQRPFYSTRRNKLQSTLDQWIRGDALIVILAGIPL